MTNQETWTVQSWREKPGKQQVNYPENRQAARDDVMKKLHSLPPLVSHVEIDHLRTQLAEVANGSRFLLQGGDCAELFEYCSKVTNASCYWARLCNQSPIENKLKVLLQMSLILVWGAKLPVVRIARMAGTPCLHHYFSLTFSLRPIRQAPFK